MTTTISWLSWTARKIASMGPATLVKRLRYPVRKRWADRVFPTRRMARQAEFVPPAAAAGLSIGEYVRTRRAPRWHWTDTDIRAIVASVPVERKARTIAEAEGILVHRYRFRGTSPLAIPPGEWTNVAASLPWVAELNRHHWFATLGFAHHYTGDVRFLRAFVEQSGDWMDQFMSRLGRMAWDSPFEIGSRINAWIWAYFLFLGSPDWDPAHRKRFIAALGLQAEYLHQTLEYHAFGNHLFLEARTLAFCGEVFPEFAGAERWRRKGWRTLRGELGQICAGGVHGERSTTYHRIIAGELAELWLFCERNHLSQSGVLEAPVRNMASFLSWIDQGGGALPLFGDSNAEDAYYRFSAPAAVAAHDAGASAELVTEDADHTFWLLGGAVTAARAARPPEGPAARAFPDGGYFVARSGWRSDADVLVWDCGPVGLGRNRKHAHLDALSFTLSVAGEPLLVDPGVHEDDGHEVELRSTRVHNTVCVDRTEQGILAQAGEIWSPPISEVLLWADGEGCTAMAGRHDGYRRLRDPVDHTRTIVVMHGLYWLIVDLVGGAGEHLVEQRFHVAADARVARGEDEDRVAISKGSVSLAMSWAGGRGAGAPADPHAPAPEIRVEPSVLEFHAGRPEPSRIVAAECRARAPIAMAVVASRAGNDVRVRWGEGPERPGWLVVTGRGFEHHVHAGCGTHLTPVLPGGWSTDAHFAIVRGFAGGEPRDVLLSSASRVWRHDHGTPAVAGERGGSGGMQRIVLEPAS